MTFGSFKVVREQANELDAFTSGLSNRKLLENSIDTFVPLCSDIPLHVVCLHLTLPDVNPKEDRQPAVPYKT
jgi:hypothetical protein